MIDPIGELSTRIVNALVGPGPHVVGVGGPVAVGKSTVATALVASLGRSRSGLRAHTLATDCFLLPNTQLTERGLLWRKGFPDTYDHDAALACVAQVRRRGPHPTVPVYSHRTYDIVAGETTAVPPVDVLVIEGVTALQEPLRSHLDVGIYVDAPEEDIVEWFVARFLRLRDESADDPESFYSALRSMTDDEVRGVAIDAWTHINGPNLHQHITPSRQEADLVIEKSRDHAIVSIGPPS